MPVRPTLLHRMAVVSFLLFRKNLGNLRKFFGQIDYRPPWQKIARTPMAVTNSGQENLNTLQLHLKSNPIGNTHRSINHMQEMITQYACNNSV